MKEGIEVAICDLFSFHIIRKWPHLVRLLLGSHTIDGQRLLL